jgi:hypothetical protein
MICFLGILSAFFSHAWAQANFSEPKGFRITKPCQATRAIRNDQDAVELEMDKVYLAYGENKKDNASHVHLGIAGKRKWASLSCGKYQDAPPVVPLDTGSDNCLPFFDEVDNKVPVGVGGEVDITPPAPPIEPFGETANTVCGTAGKETTKEEFKQLLLAHPEVLADLIDYTGGKVFADRPAHDDQEGYLNDLTEAWYAIDAFDHIFCGEPKSSNSIGGLHYHGRYQQLQASGEACRLPNFGENEVDEENGIYSMGVKMKRADGGWAKFKIKGYGLTLSAVDMLKAVTRAFAENPTSSSSSKACILSIQDGDAAFKTVFVRRAKGIRTFFPDATPSQADPSCKNPIVLPN